MEDIGKIISLNREIGNELGSLTMETKTSVINESEIDNMIDVNPLLVTLSIKIDHANNTPHKKKLIRTEIKDTETEIKETKTRINKGKYFTHLQQLILSSAPTVDRGGDVIDLGWLADKMHHLVVNDLNLLYVSRPDVDVVYSFMKQLHTIKSLRTNWDKLELLVGKHDKDDAHNILDTVDMLHIVVSRRENYKIHTEMFQWLCEWAKSITHERKLFLTIDSYDLEFHWVLVHAFQFVHLQPNQRGLKLFHLIINDMDTRLFQWENNRHRIMIGDNRFSSQWGIVSHRDNMVEEEEMVKSAELWAHLYGNGTNVKIEINTVVDDPNAFLTWLVRLTDTCNVNKARLNMQLNLHLNNANDECLDGMIPLFADLLDCNAFGTMNTIKNLCLLDPESLDMSVKHCVYNTNIQNKLHVRFTHTAPEDEDEDILDIRDMVLEQVDGTLESLVRKHLILSGYITIDQSQKRRRPDSDPDSGSESESESE